MKLDCCFRKKCLMPSRTLVRNDLSLSKASIFFLVSALVTMHLLKIFVHHLSNILLVAFSYLVECIDTNRPLQLQLHKILQKSWVKSQISPKTIVGQIVLNAFRSSSNEKRKLTWGSYFSLVCNILQSLANHLQEKLFSGKKFLWFLNLLGCEFC